MLGKLPPGVDEPRYLGGIIRQEDIRAEVELTGELLLQRRLLLRDISLRLLTAKASLSRNYPPEARFRIFLERALKAAPTIDSQFWSVQLINILGNLPSERRAEVYRSAARRISTAFHADRDRRLTLLRKLAKVCGE